MNFKQPSFIGTVLRLPRFFIRYYRILRRKSPVMKSLRIAILLALAQLKRRKITFAENCYQYRMTEAPDYSQRSMYD